jgi:signal transduction histidine kinase
VDTTAARTGVPVSLDVEDPAAELDVLDAALLEDVYRIVAEALHNSVKHADASHIAIRLAVAPHGRRRRLVAEVTDDGRGVGAATEAAAEGADCSSSGFGMTVMRERAARWGGAVRVRQPAAGGTSVFLSLPLPTSLPATDAVTDAATDAGVAP